VPSEIFHGKSGNGSSENNRRLFRQLAWTGNVGDCSDWLLIYLEFWRVTALESRCRDFSFWWSKQAKSRSMMTKLQMGAVFSAISSEVPTTVTSFFVLCRSDTHRRRWTTDLLLSQ